MHCKDVSLQKVDFQLTEKNLINLIKDWKAYTRTDYIIFQNVEEYAVVKINKIPGDELFKNLESFEIISLPDTTVFFECSELDVLNTPALAEIQLINPGKTVVVRGMFSHINFIHDMKPLKLRIIDNIPPYPSKLGVLTKKALDSGFIDVPIVIEIIDIDMSDKISEVNTEAVMFPCNVSGMSANIPFYFLDESPIVNHEVTLIGCNLSQRIFTSLYEKEAKIINVCPSENIPKSDIKTIVKCCKVKEGYVIEGNVAMVPWGATIPEIVGAINELFLE